MPWQTPHPHAVTVDEGPSLIGSTWKRRVAQGDDWDGPVAIVGVWTTARTSALNLSSRPWHSRVSRPLRATLIRSSPHTSRTSPIPLPRFGIACLI